jgi:DNA gyrase subunit A
VHEIPYQLNKARLIERIAELVKEKKLEGISELRDESDKDGLRMVIELRKGEIGDVVLNNLYAQTRCRTSSASTWWRWSTASRGCSTSRRSSRPSLRHRREVVTRRTVYLLRKARERGHVLEGLAIALANIDRVIELIKASPSPAEAREALLAERWLPGEVMSMLERAGAEACRPDELEPEFGLHDGRTACRRRRPRPSSTCACTA